jgi:hypothetical protein
LFSAVGLKVANCEPVILELLADVNLPRQRGGWVPLMWYHSKDGDAININPKLTLLVFIVFFLALALVALWML